jgi:hypothetical protein
MNKLKLLIIFSILFLSVQAQAANNRALKPVSSSSAGKRVALVIGNDAYKAVTPLKNAVADAQAMAAALNRAGFSVTLKTNTNLAAMKKAVREFKASLSGGDEAVFFYSGHGVQMGEGNFLLPIDIISDSPEQVMDDAIPLQRLLGDLEAQKVKFALAIIDACRDNPFKGSGRSIGGARGLAPTSAANGQMIIFSAGNGQQALDRLNDNDRQTNGVFTRVFLEEMQRPGVEVHQVVQSVRRRVDTLAKSVNHDQVPALYDQVVGDFMFYPADTAAPSQQIAYIPPSPPPVQVAVKSKDQIEDEYWEAIKDSNDLASLQQYLSDYPNGRYLGLAKIKIGKLKSVVAPVVQTVNRPVSRMEGEPEMIAIPGRNYELGKFEVTQAQWRAVMGNNPSKFTACGDNCPVENVSWNDIQEFLQKLNAKTGKNYRLPTESEWEYACYGGTKTKYCGSNNINAVAWYYTGADSVSTHPVGQKQANGYGLYDMSGNVWEWMSDCYDASCTNRVLRGGSWGGYAQDARAANRNDDTPAKRYNIIGFRLARTLP